MTDTTELERTNNQDSAQDRLRDILIQEMYGSSSIIINSQALAEYYDACDENGSNLPLGDRERGAIRAVFGSMSAPVIKEVINLLSEQIAGRSLRQLDQESQLLADGIVFTLIHSIENLDNSNLILKGIAWTGLLASGTITAAVLFDSRDSYIAASIVARAAGELVMRDSFYEYGASIPLLAEMQKAIAYQVGKVCSDIDLRIGLDTYSLQQYVQGQRIFPSSESVM